MGGAGEIHFERGDATERIVRHRVVGEANALGVLGPEEVLAGGEVTHSAIPKSPPGLNFSVGLWVVSEGGSPSSAGDLGDACHQFTEEFGGVVGVDDVRSAATEMELIEEVRYQGGGVAIREGDDEDSFCKAVDEVQGFGFAGSGETLALEIHRVAGTGFDGGVGRK